MREYSLDSNADNIFLINFSELKERFDPIYYTDVLTYLNKSSYEKFKLNALCYSFTSGFGAGGNDQTDEQNGIIQIRPTNLDNDGNLIFNRNIYVPNDNIGSKFIVENNDILFNNTNSQERVGKTAIAEDIGDNIYTFSNHITKFRVRENLVLPKYLFILLNLYQSRKIFYSICTNWNNQSGVGLDLLKKLIIPVPPKNKQQLVVDCYNKAYQAKQHKEQEAKSLLSSIDDYLLSELDIKLPEINNSLEDRMFISVLSSISSKRFDCDYYKIYYQKLIGSIDSSSFDLQTLDSVCHSIKSGRTPAKDDYRQEVTNFPIIKVGSYSKDYIDLTKVDYSSYASSVVAHVNDIFILSAAHQSEYVGRHIKLLNVEPQLSTSFVGELICITTNVNKCNPIYLFSLLKTNIYKDLLNREKTGQTSHIYSKDIKNIKIPLPSLEKQNEIADHISNIRQTAEQLEQEANDIMENAKDEVERLILGQ